MIREEEITIDICVCTFRRPHVADTLRSLAALRLKPGWRSRVIVADNDDSESARASVENVSKAAGLTLVYIHAPARNISVARNACLDAASAPLLAFIDDDETVAPGWLEAMLAAREETRADVVLGPVRAVYGAYCPAWARREDYHSTRPVWVEGRIVTGYAGNVLIDRASPAVQGLRFRPDLGSGGEDTAYFSAITQAGGEIAYAPDAVTEEDVPPSRASLRWLLTRRFRCGRIHGLLLLETSRPMGTSRAKAAAKTLFCFMCALLCIPHAPYRRFWLLRGAFHAGAAAKLLKGRAA